MLRRSLVPFLVAAQILGSTQAFAQSDRRKEADTHFKTANEHFFAKRYGEALDEYQKAYDAQPAALTLYNLGQVHLVLGHWPEALEAYEHYLSDGGATIPTKRKGEVEAEIKKLRGRLGDLSVRVEPDGAEVRVDGRVIGQSPLAKAVRIETGTHTVVASLDGYKRAERNITVTTADLTTLTLALVKIAPDAPPVTVDAPPVTVEDRLPPPARPAASRRPLFADVDPNPRAVSPPAPEPPAPERATMAQGQRTVGTALEIVGGAGAILGGLYLLSVLDKRSEATKDAAAAIEKRDVAAYQDARSRHDEAQNHIVPTALVTGGGAAVALIGYIVVHTASSSDSAGVRLSPWMSGQAMGATFAGGF